MDTASVSLVLPVRDEAGAIGRCLAEVERQTYPRQRMEILVVDGISTDGTREKVKKYEGRKSMPALRLIDNPKRQRAAGLNAGIRAARGEVIIRVDARAIIPPDYVEKCVAALAGSGADNAGGMQKPVAGCPGPGAATRQAIAIAMSHRFGVGNARFRLGKGSGFVDTVYLGCFRREVFDRVGLFDEDSAVISEDADLNYRIRQAGGKIWFSSDIVAWYLPRDSIRELGRLYYRYGGAKAGNLLRRGRLTASRQLAPPLFLFSLVLLPVLGLFDRLPLLVWSALLAAYLLATLFFALHALLKSDESPGGPPPASEPRLAVFPRLLLVFPTMHLSWAAGFWRRLLQRPAPGQYWGN